MSKLDKSNLIKTFSDCLASGSVADAMSYIRNLSVIYLLPSDMQKISRLIDRYRDVLSSFSSNKSLKIAVLGGFTTSVIVNAIKTHLLAEGWVVESYESEYDLYKIEVLDASSGLYAFQPEVVLFATGTVNIEEFPLAGSTAGQVTAMAETLVEQFRDLWEIVKEKTGATIIQHNFEYPVEQLLSRLEFKYSWSHSKYVETLNNILWQMDSREMYLLDIFGSSVRCGLTRWLDSRWWYFGKFGINPELSWEYGRMFAGLHCAIAGKSKKCLVVDLDNTLWGGIVGDDGIEGIQIGNISATGEAYSGFCRYIKELRKRGIILAVCSKNDSEQAKEVFLKHSEMPLKLDDFACFCCNWQSKSENIASIAEHLNIGMDSLVFVDDNPVECAEVSRTLPEVAVIEMDGDPAYFIEKLEKLHLFNQLEITREDLGRTDSYLQRGKVESLRKSALNLEGFLESLCMAGRVDVATENDLPRICQMFNKTNQFNLTGRKYDTSNLSEYILNTSKFCLCSKLCDKFADYGLVSAITGEISEDILRIDNWIMSCRVFSRTFEQFIFNHLVNYASEMNCSTICGEFIRTVRNNYVADLFKKLGFRMIDSNDSERWYLAVESFESLKTYVKVFQGAVKK
ncbi:MAG: HAD-IIIC family phosphatase [Anaerohalosphaeraceae bacterium]|nr:HAD-IIIC family phosphatase [Anaerohalosphaeraceae bacterium]